MIKHNVIAISDTHNHNFINIPYCDFLVFAGDYSNYGTINETEQFIYWLNSVPARYIIFVPGNHDFIFESNLESVKGLLPDNCYVLIDEYIELEGVKFYGTPQTVRFGMWAFMKTEEQLNSHWRKIPKGLDVLVTHQPPKNMLDLTQDGRSVGSVGLMQVVQQTKPKYHVFGHIHESAGSSSIFGSTFINASAVNVRLQNINNYHEFTIEK